MGILDHFINQRRAQNCKGSGIRCSGRAYGLIASSLTGSTYIRSIVDHQMKKDLETKVMQGLYRKYPPPEIRDHHPVNIRYSFCAIL